jgi:hypothetical protein
MPRPQFRIDWQRDLHVVRIVVQSGGAGFVMGIVFGLTVALLMAAIFTAIGLVFYRIVVVGSADLVGGAVLPDRRGHAGASYSHIEAMEARGDLDGALVAWEAEIAASPHAYGARVHAADLYARGDRDAARAAELFRTVKDSALAPRDTKRYAWQRLIDLYLGPLDQRGRAMVELRRLADQWPGTPEATGALAALATLKSELQPPVTD